MMVNAPMPYDDLLDEGFLTHEQEIALAERIQVGDQDALDELVRHNVRLVHHITRRYYAPDLAMTWDDLIQEGMIGLLTAARKFEPERGLRFSTYATTWVRQKISRACLVNGTIRRSANPNYPRQRPKAIRDHALRQNHVSRLDQPFIDHKGAEGNTLADIIADAAPSVEEQVFSAIEQERLIAALCLGARAEAVIRMWLSGVPRQEAQALHGVSRSYIHNILTQRREKLMSDEIRICSEPDCEAPCMVSQRGITLPRCHEHQEAFWRETAKDQRQASGEEEPQRKRGRPRKSYPAATPAPLAIAESPSQVVSSEDCACPDCIYREIVTLLATRNPRIAELAQVLKTARRLRDDLGI